MYELVLHAGGIVWAPACSWVLLTFSMWISFWRMEESLPGTLFRAICLMATGS